MAKTFTQTAGAALIGATLMASVLAGCGSQGMPNSLAARANAAAMEAEATSTLMTGLARIHGAIFNKLDKDSNKRIDEYEAGTNLTMADFAKADKNKDHKLTFAEFKGYAITNLFFFRDTKEAFTKRFRADLKKAFDRLDNAPRDGQLVKNETSLRDLQKLGLTFEYPRLNVTVKVNKIDQATFDAADKTGDKLLGQAEFEDLYIEMVIAALGGVPGTGGGDTPPEPAPAPGTDPNVPPVPADPAVTPAEPPAEEPAAPAKKKK